MCAMSIGELSRAAELPVATIRYYESVGLLPKASRRAGGHREFSRVDLERLRFVTSRRALGFSIAQVRDLLDHAGPGTQPCADARASADLQLAAVRGRMAELKAIEASLLDQIASCDTGCGDGAAPSCALVPQGEPPRLRERRQSPM
jgi:DNA-binding transcriptional MerR regulator